MLAAGSMLEGQRRRTSHKISDGSYGPGDAIIAAVTIDAFAKSRPRWDIGDCSQHTSQIGWRVANVVHEETQFVVDPLLDRQPQRAHMQCALKVRLKAYTFERNAQKSLQLLGDFVVPRLPTGACLSTPFVSLAHLILDP